MAEPGCEVGSGRSATAVPSPSEYGETVEAGEFVLAGSDCCRMKVSMISLS